MLYGDNDRVLVKKFNLEFKHSIVHTSYQFIHGKVQCVKIQLLKYRGILFDSWGCILAFSFSYWLDSRWRHSFFLSTRISYFSCFNTFVGLFAFRPFLNFHIWCNNTTFFHTFLSFNTFLICFSQLWLISLKTSFRIFHISKKKKIAIVFKQFSVIYLFHI